MTKAYIQPNVEEIADAIVSSSEGLTAEQLTERFLSYSEATKAYLMTKGLLMQLIALEFNVLDKDIWEAVSLVKDMEELAQSLGVDID